jgi:hypothetical protein
VRRLTALQAVQASKAGIKGKTASQRSRFNKKVLNLYILPAISGGLKII